MRRRPQEPRHSSSPRGRTRTRAHGVTVTSALNLWLHDVDRARVVAVTGTKGKSTTTALITFFLACLGHEAQRLGNIGQPPYDPSVDTSTGWLVLEVSSFQAVDLDVAPRVVVVTSLGSDHVDWHGSLEQYRQRQALTHSRRGSARTPSSPTARRCASARARSAARLTTSRPTRRARRALGLIGAHNDSNVALALAAVATLTGDESRRSRGRPLDARHDFTPLRGRLTLVATENVGATTRALRRRRARHLGAARRGRARGLSPTSPWLSSPAASTAASSTGSWPRPGRGAPPTTLITVGQRGRSHQRRSAPSSTGSRSAQRRLHASRRWSSRERPSRRGRRAVIAGRAEL